MNKFAIQGHNTRGREVIHLLESLGGKNTNNLKGSAQFDYYWINSEDNSINMNTLSYIRKYDIVDFYTLEEFEELEKSCGNVIDMVSSFQPQETLETNISVSFIDDNQIPQYEQEDMLIGFVKETEDRTKLIIPEDYKLKIDGDNAYLVKKLIYPKTYKDCRDVLGYKNRNNTTQDFLNSCDLYDSELMTRLSMLKLCRDAYWKVYGDIHNLNKPWEPDWTQQTTKYCIWNCKNKVDKFESTFANFMLTFPTSELRDTFLENFKNLIESCKELI